MVGRQVLLAPSKAVSAPGKEVQFRRLAGRNSFLVDRGLSDLDRHIERYLAADNKAD
jgi:hypothetical protein